jgi:hypothetical protein
MRFPFVAADTSTRDNDLDCRFFCFADRRRLMDDWSLAFKGSLFLDAISFLDCRLPAGWTNRGSIIKGIGFHRSCEEAGNAAFEMRHTTKG